MIHVGIQPFSCISPLYLNMFSTTDIMSNEIWKEKQQEWWITGGVEGKRRNWVESVDGRVCCLIGVTADACSTVEDFDSEHEGINKSFRTHEDRKSVSARERAHHRLPVLLPASMQIDKLSSNWLFLWWNRIIIFLQVASCLALVICQMLFSSFFPLTSLFTMICPNTAFLWLFVSCPYFCLAINSAVQMHQRTFRIILPGWIPHLNTPLSTSFIHLCPTSSCCNPNLKTFEQNTLTGTEMLMRRLSFWDKVWLLWATNLDIYDCDRNIIGNLLCKYRCRFSGSHN